MTYHRTAEPGVEEILALALVRGDTETAQRIADRNRIDLDTLLEICGRHRIAPLALKRLTALSLGDPLRPRVIEAARGAVMAALAHNAGIRAEIARFTELCRAGGIEFLLIKGMAIDKELTRSTNDVDVLIEPADLERTFAALEGAGYRYVGSAVLSSKERRDVRRQLRWNNQFQFQSPDAPLQIEVHIRLFERDRIRLEKLDRLLDRTDLFWEKRRYDGEIECWVPAPEASLALLCVHSATKRSPAHGSYILRHALDIARLLREGLDWDYFLHLCRLWEIEYYAYVSLRLAVLSLGAPRAQALAELLHPALNRRTRFLAGVHCRCYTGLGAPSRPFRMLYRLAMPVAIGGSFRKALRWYRETAFPPLWLQEARIGVPRSSPRLYPTYVAFQLARVGRALARRVAGQRNSRGQRNGRGLDWPGRGRALRAPALHPRLSRGTRRHSSR